MSSLSPEKLAEQLRSPTQPDGNPWPLPNLHQEAADEIEQLSGELALMKTAVEHADSERAFAVDGFKTEEAIVDRVWKALGISTYEEADGKAIDEIVADWKTRALAAESSVSRLTERAETAERERDAERRSARESEDAYQSLTERLQDLCDRHGCPAGMHRLAWLDMQLKTPVDAEGTAREHGRDAAEVAREIIDSWEAGCLVNGNWQDHKNCLHDAITTAILSERAEAEKMRKALAPFAKKATEWEQRHPSRGIYPTSDTNQITHRLGDFREARRALAPEPATASAMRDLKHGGRDYSGDLPKEKPDG